MSDTFEPAAAAASPYPAPLREPKRDRQKRYAQALCRRWTVAATLFWIVASNFWVGMIGRSKFSDPIEWTDLAIFGLGYIVLIPFLIASLMTARGAARLGFILLLALATFFLSAFMLQTYAVALEFCGRG